MGHTQAQITTGFGVAATRAYRHVTETVQLLATLAPGPIDALGAASVKAYLILDGTLLPIDRIAADRPCCSGEHKRHGMNVQVVADPFGRLLRPCPAPSTTSARPVPTAPSGPASGAGPTKGYRGAPNTVRIPCWRRWEALFVGQQAVSRSHVKIRALVEQAVLTLHLTSSE